jgi:ATP-binding cassette subfamily B protein
MASDRAGRATAFSRRWTGVRVSARAFGRGVAFTTRLLVNAAPGLAAVFLVLSILQAVLPVLNVRLTQLIVNSLAAGQDLRGLIAPLLVYLAFHLTAAGLAPAMNTFTGLVSERLTGHVNLLVLSRVNAITDLTRFEDPALYDDLQIIGNRAPHLARNLLRSMTEVAQAGLAATGLCLLLASLHPLVPLVLLAATAPATLVQRQSAMLRWHLQVETAELERRQNYWLEVGTSPGYAREVQLFGIARWVRGQFEQALAELDRRRWRLRRRLLGWTFATIVARFAGTAGVLLYLLAGGASGQVRPGDFVLFLGSLFLLDGHLRFLPLWVTRVVEEAHVTDRFLKFLEPDESSRTTPLRTSPSPPLEGRLGRGVEVAHLSFRYPGREERVLQDVSFEIRPGETVALVGLNGAGKTTLVKLLTGLYGPTSSTIRVGGHDLSNCDIRSLRAGIAVVFQDYGRYFLTAGENIGLGCVAEIENRQQIEQAARDGGAEPLIRRLEHGYDTRLGKEFGGTQLSGGEWQRLALSRAFMRAADLVILDEPTAGLDVRAEAEIYERFRTLLGGRCGLLISHRFSTVRMADRILVLDEGRIVEDGTHETLMERGGLYARMFRMQAEAFQPVEEANA